VVVTVPEDFGESVGITSGEPKAIALSGNYDLRSVRLVIRDENGHAMCQAMG
jgi:hypothetical protein